MTEAESHNVRSGVIATVVGGLILAAILYAVPYVRDILLRFVTWIWSGVVWVAKNLIASYQIPGWLLIILGLLALYSVTRILSTMIHPSSELTFKKYTQDIIYGAKWRWSWNGNSVSDLWCYCPTCDAMLVYDDSSCRQRYTELKTDFICERCNRQVVASISGGDKLYAVGAAERELRRRVRTNEYVNAINGVVV